MSEEKLILVINPGSTSTKVAIYKDKMEMDTRTLQHSPRELERYPEVKDQLDFRRDAVEAYLKDLNIPLTALSAIAARGGAVGKLNCGAYQVDRTFVEACRKPLAPHVSNLAAIIAYELACEAGIHAYIYDAVCGCGNPEELYTLSGIPEIERPFFTHVLNSRAVCIEQAERDHKKLSETTYIVTHMGGGITTNLIHKGRILDIVADDEGTFTPERSGGVPCRELVKLCYSGKYTEKEMQARLKGKGGMQAYLGTNDLQAVEEMITKGDRKAELVYQAMAMQIGKDIGSLCTVAEGRVDKIILTGGMAYSKSLTALIQRKVSFLAPVSVFTGSHEMQALGWGILRVMNGEEEAQVMRMLPK
jgi:butyrate kinase